MAEIEDTATGAATDESVNPETEAATETAEPGSEAEGQPVEQVVGEAGEQDGTGDAEAQAKADAEKFEKKKQTASDRIAQLTQRQRQAERERDVAVKEADRLKKRLEATPTTEAPKLENFETVEAFTASLAAHEVTQASRQVREQEFTADIEDAEARRETHQSDVAQAALAQYNVRADVFAERVSDFDEVMKSARIEVGQAAIDQIQSSRKGPEIAYFLAKNPAEAARLADLRNPLDVAREVGSIEGRLSARAPKRTTQAPAPVGAVAKGSGSSSDFDPATATVKEMAKHLKETGVIT